MPRPGASADGRATRSSRPGPSEIHQVAPYGVGQRLDAYLSRYLAQHSRAEWQRLIDSQIVTLNGAATRSSARLVAGDRLEIRPVAAFAMLEPDSSIKLDVIYEDDAILVINKPAGLVVHPAPGHETGTLVHALLAQFPGLQDPTGLRRPGIIHRLDKDTSGLMVVGKTIDAVSAVQAAMQRDETLKRYRLLVHGNIVEDQALIEIPVGRDPNNRQRMSARVDGRAARTEFEVLERLAGYTFVEAKLHTGRTHQLRVHFSYIQHPVAGDRTYGSRRGPDGLQRQFLHSYGLALRSPLTGAQLDLTAPLPPDLTDVLDRLRATENRVEAVTYPVTDALDPGADLLGSGPYPLDPRPDPFDPLP